ncbi:hypothetical protein [Streptomyces sp. Inha503]|uniref:hypothetical protein n=1 Tax=Streptomyces sp. Inha503 TaxID=3383314 RepID=UPI0039A27A9F
MSVVDGSVFHRLVVPRHRVDRRSDWRTESVGGRLEPELLADRPVEERLRPV